MLVFSPLFLPLTLSQSQHSSCQLLFLSCFLSPHHPQLLSSLVTSPTWILSRRYLVLLWVPICQITTSAAATCEKHRALGSGRTEVACPFHMGPSFLLNPQGRKCPGKAMQNCLDSNSSPAIPGLGVAKRIFSNFKSDFYSCVSQKNTEEVELFFL